MVVDLNKMDKKLVYQKLHYSEKFGFDVELKALALYYEIIAKRDYQLNFEFLVDDYNIILHLFQLNKKKNKNTSMIDWLHRINSLYSIAYDNKIILHKQYNLTLDEIAGKIVSDIGRLKQKYI